MNLTSSTRQHKRKYLVKSTTLHNGVSEKSIEGEIKHSFFGHE